MDKVKYKSIIARMQLSLSELLKAINKPFKRNKKATR